MASKYLKILIISMFKDLKENSSKRKEMETLKKNQMKILELRNTIPESKNSLWEHIRKIKRKGQNVSYLLPHNKLSRNSVA